MSGVKGRSGRKSKRDEEKRLEVIEKAWDVVREFISSTDQPIDKKVQEAIKVVLKDMPQAPLMTQDTYITKVTYEWCDPQEDQDSIRTSRLPEGESSTSSEI